jgi:hypothetical protein
MSHDTPKGMARHVWCLRAACIGHHHHSFRSYPDRLAGRGGWRVEVPGPTRSTVGVGLAGQGAGADGAGQPTRALA